MRNVMDGVEEQNSENADADSLHKLRSHRDNLAKSLREIDDLLLSQKQNSDSSHSQHDNIGNAEGGDSQSESASKLSGESLPKSPHEIQREIVNELKWAWKCYKECAWGFDTVHPIACTGTNDAFDMGLAMIDALDTMIIMNSVVCSVPVLFCVFKKCVMMCHHVPWFDNLKLRDFRALSPSDVSE